MRDARHQGAKEAKSTRPACETELVRLWNRESVGKEASRGLNFRKGSTLSRSRYALFNQAMARAFAKQNLIGGV
jgi:hypothetical protein